MLTGQARLPRRFMLILQDLGLSTFQPSIPTLRSACRGRCSKRSRPKDTHGKPEPWSIGYRENCPENNLRVRAPAQPSDKNQKGNSDRVLGERILPRGQRRGLGGCIGRFCGHASSTQTCLLAKALEEPPSFGGFRVHEQRVSGLSQEELLRQRCRSTWHSIVQL